MKLVYVLNIIFGDSYGPTGCYGTRPEAETAYKEECDKYRSKCKKPKEVWQPLDMWCDTFDKTFIARVDGCRVSVKLSARFVKNN